MELVIINQVNNGGGLDYGGSKKADRKWSDSRYILKMSPTEFSEELNAGYMRKREIKEWLPDTRPEQMER